MKTIIITVLTVISLASCNTKEQKFVKKIEYINANNGKEVRSLQFAADLKAKGKLLIKDLKTGKITKADSIGFVGVDANGFSHFPDGHTEAPASYF